MITIFTMPKPFLRHIAVIQRNAILSWTLLRPECEIILLGDEVGTANVAAKFGIRHIPEIARNEYGTPLVSDIFAQAKRFASHEILCYVNADIIFLSDFMFAIKRVASIKQRFLMAGQRWDLDFDQPLPSYHGWEAQLKALLRQSAKIHPKCGIDYFVFPLGLFNEIPPFAVGRPGWDNWMIYKARTTGADVIDSTEAITAIHQNHDYSHVPQRIGNTYEGPEAQHNCTLADNRSLAYTLNDANYILTQNYLRPTRCPALTDLPAPISSKSAWPWTEESRQLPDIMPGGSRWPKISIVTPSYNQAKFLEETIRSVLLQGYPNLEYIIMDGGSTDGSREIIERYQPWLSHVRIGPDEGQAAAIAEGFNLASGDVLAWLNSDDRYLPDSLGRVARFFTDHPDVTFASGDINYIDVQGRILERVFAVRPNRSITANIGLHCWPQPGCFWRRWAYEEAGGIDASLQFCMDRDLFIRLIGVGQGSRIPGPPLADFRAHDEAKSSTMLETGKKEDALIIQRYSSPGLRNSPGLVKLYWRFWGVPTRVRALSYRLTGWEF